MFTRKQLLLVPAEYGRIAHEAYFEELVNAHGGFKAMPIPFTSKQVKEALESGDIHLNTLPLEKWDYATDGIRMFSKPLKDRDEWNTLATRVCMLKAAARMRYEHEKFLSDHIEIVHVA